MLVTIIIEMLAAFLVALFKRWLDSKINPSPTALLEGKKKFLNSVRWRFWLGPDRMPLAEKAFTASLKRYKETVHYVSKIEDPEAFSKFLTENLTVV